LSFEGASTSQNGCFYNGNSQGIECEDGVINGLSVQTVTKIVPIQLSLRMPEWKSYYWLIC